MTTKTITLDFEAYEALRRLKGKGESFSDVVKRHFARGAPAGSWGSSWTAWSSATMRWMPWTS